MYIWEGEGFITLRQFLMSRHSFFYLSAILYVFGMFTASGEYAPVLPFDMDDTIEELRIKIAHNGYNFYVDHNPVYDAPQEQKDIMFSRHAPGIPLYNEGFGLSPLQLLTQQRDLPTSFCWTNVNGHTYIGPIKDQGLCGACYAFSGCAVAESAYNQATGLYDSNCVDFSEAYMAFCLSDYYTGFDGCQGSDYDYQELTALTIQGICTESNYPYTDNEQDCGVPGSVDTIIFNAWHRLPCNNIEAIKTAIMDYGAVDAAVKVSSAFQAYSGGIYQDTINDCDAEPCYYTETDHAVALVGWDDSDGTGYWILRNSWGTNWGENGYARIRYDSAHVSCECSYLIYSNSGTAPSATTLPATDIASNSASLHASINPHGNDTWYWFSYGTNTAPTQQTIPTNSLNSLIATNVTTVLSGLSAKTHYYYQVNASNQHGLFSGNLLSFDTTAASPMQPDVTTESADSIHSSSARLPGYINPNGLACGYYFDFGKTTNFSRQTPITQLAADWVEQAIDITISGLEPNQTYHYRLVATNAEGQSVGTLMNFKTLAISDVLLFEDFENGGAIPPGWSQQSVTGSNNWQFTCGDPKHSFPDQPYEGNYNAFLSYSGYTPQKTLLISPRIDFGYSTNNPTLSFQLHNQRWYEDQDILKVVYKSVESGPWVTLQTYETSITNWEEQTLTLPTPSQNYYIAFEGESLFGYGIAIDNVQVTGFSPAAAPSPSVDTLYAAPVSSNTAILRGTVNPNGEPTWYYFEYGTNIDYGVTSDSYEIGSNVTAVLITNNVTSLISDTTYHYRLVASNLTWISYGNDNYFHTLSGLPEPPHITNLTISYITDRSATFTAQIHPEGLPTAYHLEYGTNGLMESHTATSQIPCGGTYFSVSNVINNLLPEILYYYRLQATNNAGITYSIQGSFTTSNRSSLILSESFEHNGSMPVGWNETYLSGSHNWEFEPGNPIDYHPHQAHDGHYNALFRWEDGVTRLVSPTIDFSGYTNRARLIFWLFKDEWFKNQDELRIYYKSSTLNPWTLLRIYNEPVSNWTRNVVSLPEPSPDYHLAFEGIAGWGYGICLDNIEIHGHPTPSPMSITNLTHHIASNTLEIMWNSFEDNHYTIYVSTNLQEGFSTLQTNLSATPPANTITDQTDQIGFKCYLIEEINP